MATLYAHQSSLGASYNQQVAAGQTIGWVGTTGLSTGCHLHYEVRINGNPVDPTPYM
jgi:murein DD-endopeptidase MepM/ murein hydrolase activator NlpD